MLVMSGAVAYSRRRVCNGAQVEGSPTPGRGWLPSTGVTRCVASWPTNPTLADVEGVRRYSAKTFHCCVNCGRRFGSHARTWPDGLSSGLSSAKPVVRVPATVVAALLKTDYTKT